MTPRSIETYLAELEAAGLSRKWGDACLEAGKQLQKQWQKWGIEWITPDKVGICTVCLAFTGMFAGSLLFPDPEGHIGALTEAHEASEREEDECPPSPLSGSSS